MNKIILVTGGEGYVGSNLIKKLLNEGHNVYSIDNEPKPKNRHDGATYIQLDAKSINRFFTGAFIDRFDTVFHFGEYSRIRSSFDDVDTIMNDNFLGTYEVVQFCKDRKIKLIYSASSSGFGGNENLSPYSWQKTKSVELIKNYQDWFGTFTHGSGHETPHLRYGIAYFYNVYGKNHIKSGKMATVIGIFEDAMEKGLPIPVIGDGQQSRDFTHINDIVEGLYNIFTQEQYEDAGEYHLGTGINHKILDIANMFGDVQHIPKVNGERPISSMPKHKSPKWWKSSIKIDEYISKLKLNPITNI
jgi:UDP-glucose 4-epimerase